MKAFFKLTTLLLVSLALQACVFRYEVPKGKTCSVSDIKKAEYGIMLRTEQITVKQYFSLLDQLDSLDKIELKKD